MITVKILWMLLRRDFILPVGPISKTDRESPRINNDLGIGCSKFATLFFPSFLSMASGMEVLGTR